MEPVSYTTEELQRAIDKQRRYSLPHFIIGERAYREVRNPSDGPRQNIFPERGRGFLSWRLAEAEEIAAWNRLR